MKPFVPSFDPARIDEYFKIGEELAKAAQDFSKVDPKALDPVKLYEAQRTNMDALVEANRKAAEAYEALFRKQVDVLRDSAERLQKRLEELRADPAQAMEPKKQAEAMQEMVEETARQLAELADSAAKLGSDTLEGIGRQVAANASALAGAARA